MLGRVAVAKVRRNRPVGRWARASRLLDSTLRAYANLPPGPTEVGGGALRSLQMALTTTEPSPTLLATRLIEPERTSPTAKMPGQDVAKLGARHPFLKRRWKHSSKVINSARSNGIRNAAHALQNSGSVAGFCSKTPPRYSADRKRRKIRVLEKSWLGWKDSNLRMPVPKTSALPLGYTPAALARLAVCRAGGQRMSASDDVRAACGPSRADREPGRAGSPPAAGAAVRWSGRGRRCRS